LPPIEAAKVLRTWCSLQARHRESGIPEVGHLSKKEKAHQRKRWFRHLRRFRCGIEASISMLKRKFGLGRVLARGSAGTGIWTGLAIFAYNL
jgi:hypothetical protein